MRLTILFNSKVNNKTATKWPAAGSRTTVNYKPTSV